VIYTNKIDRRIVACSVSFNVSATCYNCLPTVNTEEEEDLLKDCEVRCDGAHPHASVKPN